MTTKTLPILQKAPYGEACNRCGFCCRRSPCNVARLLVHAPAYAPCPILIEHEDGTTSCGVLADPEKYITPEYKGVLRVLTAVEDRQPSDDPRELVAPFILSEGGGCDSVDRRGVDADLMTVPTADLARVFDARTRARLQSREHVIAEAKD